MKRAAIAFQSFASPTALQQTGYPWAGPAVSKTALTIGSLVAGRYQILDKLGQGGMGIVYVAEQKLLERKVALKVLSPESDSEARERFVREARAASRLQHPNIATVYDFGNAEHGPFLAMEYIDGRTLREVLSESKVLRWERAHTLALQVAQGLAAAHHQGIVHRDIKPENLIIQRDGEVEQIKILDFGLANLVSGLEPALTQSGFVMGTAGYISPEQLEGVTNDVRSDLYSLGIILYEILAGAHPFSGKTAAALAIAHATKKPRPLSQLAPDAPMALCQVVDRLLAKNPADRPADAGVLVGVLGAVGTTETTASHSPTGSRWPGMVDDRAPRGTVTLVFTDIEGSTAIWEREPRAMRLALDMHNTLMREFIEAYQGYEVKTQGDSFMVAFATELDALKWCISVQRALLAQQWPPEILRCIEERADGDREPRLPGLCVRMGVHWGKPECRRGPVTGRMDYFGPMVNRAARIESAAHGGQILVSDAFANRVKGDVAELDASLASRGEHALKGLDDPELLTEIVDELAPWQSFPDPRTTTRNVQGNLLDEHSAFVGRQAEIDNIAKRFAGGACLVTLLGPGGTGKTRLSRVAARHMQREQIGLQEVWFCDLSAATRATAIVATVADVLSIPLSGGAQLSDAIDLVGRGLVNRGVVLLVLDNLEQILEEAAKPIAIWLQQCPNLRILATSREALNLENEQRLEIAPLDEDGGIALFEARVKELGKPPTGETETVRQLVIALDGMPLAIELAASRIGLMKPQQILERLHRRFDLLKGTRRGVSERQATLRGAIDWSWDLLSEAERAAFAQLSVFEGGFSIEAAEEILDLSRFEDAPFVLDIVQALKDKSLLSTAASKGHELRLTMLKSIHEYAAGKLLESKEEEDSSTDFMQDALAMARRSGDLNMEARVWVNIGTERMVRGQLPESIDAMMQALGLHREHKARALEALTMGNIGTLTLALGDADSSERWLRDAIAIHREFGNTLLQGADQSNLARTLIEASRIHEAIALGTEALVLIEQANGAREKLLCLCNLAVAHACIDNLEEALQYFAIAKDTSFFWRGQTSLFLLVQAHVDLAAARQAGATADDERVTSARSSVQKLMAQGPRFFLPLQSLIRYAKSFPKRAPVLDSPPAPGHGKNAD